MSNTFIYVQSVTYINFLVADTFMECFPRILMPNISVGDTVVYADEFLEPYTKFKVVDILSSDKTNRIYVMMERID